MIKTEKVAIDGWEAAIRGMRNPMNSWDNSDTRWNLSGKTPEIGPNDLERMTSLVKAGSDHRKFMRYINVTMDITAPLYWWKEFDTYKVGTVRNSCSTMHKITDRDLTIDDFSHDKLMNDAMNLLHELIDEINYYRRHFLCTNKKEYWWQIIQLLPSSYNQKATVQLNYEVLRNMYHSRKEHKLDEWKEFCKTIETLPYSELITQ